MISKFLGSWKSIQEFELQETQNNPHTHMASAPFQGPEVKFA